MKTKILAILLVLTLMLSVCSISVFADGDTVSSTVADMPQKVITARIGAVTLDGVPEAAISPDTALTADQSKFARVGAAWDEVTEALYVAVHSERYNGEYTQRGGLKHEVRNTFAADSEYGLITGVTLEFGDVVYELDGEDLTNPADESLAAEFQISEEQEKPAERTEVEEPSPEVLDKGAYVEFKIPLKALNVYRDSNGNVFTPVKMIVVSNYIETETFDGAIEFTMNKIAHSSNMTGWYSGIGGLAPYFPHFATGSGGDMEDDTYSKWTTPIANPDNGISQLASRLDFDKDGLISLQQFLLSAAPLPENPVGTTLFMTKNQPIELQMDFQMSSNAPVSAPFTTEDFNPNPSSNKGNPGDFILTTGNGFRGLITLGFDGAMSGGTAYAKYCVVLAVYNTEDGLKMYLDDSISPYGGEGIALGKNAGDVFKLSLEVTPNLDLAGFSIASTDIVVKVDGAVVGTLTQTENHTGTAGYRTVGIHYGIACDKLDTPVDDVAYVNYYNVSISNTASGNVANIIKDLVATYTEASDAPIETTTTKLVFTQKPATTTTKAATTTTTKVETTTVEEAAATTTTEAKSGGCGGSIAVTGITLMLGSAAITVIATSKKKED